MLRYITAASRIKAVMLLHVLITMATLSSRKKDLEIDIGSLLSPAIRVSEHCEVAYIDAGYAIVLLTPLQGSNTNKVCIRGIIHVRTVVAKSAPRI